MYWVGQNMQPALSLGIDLVLGEEVIELRGCLIPCKFLISTVS